MPLTLGYLGVAVFFVISGFCIHLSHGQSRDKSWPVFFIRRLCRIYPPYLVILLFFAFVFPTTRLNFQDAPFPSMARLISHLLMVHNFVWSLFYGINGVLWSVANVPVLSVGRLLLL
ncbi:MAG: acyltransferase family protein [Verrucomicrobiota bacterium]